MEEMLKNLVKEAVMEALAEMMNQDVAVMSADKEQPKDSENKEDGNKKKPIRPEPSLGVGGFSLRK